MKRINTIVWSNKEPDTNVLWLKGRELLHFNNDEWLNIVGNDRELLLSANKLFNPKEYENTFSFTGTTDAITKFGWGSNGAAWEIGGSNDGIYFRKSLNETTWDTWNKIPTTKEVEESINAIVKPATAETLGMVKSVGHPSLIAAQGDNKVGIGIGPDGKMWMSYSSYGSSIFWYETLEGSKEEIHLPYDRPYVKLSIESNATWDRLSACFNLEVLSEESYNQWVDTNHQFPLNEISDLDYKLVTAGGLKAALPSLLYISATDGEWNKALIQNYLNTCGAIPVLFKIEDFKWHYSERDQLYLDSKYSTLPAILYLSPFDTNGYGYYLGTFIKGVYTKWKINNDYIPEKLKTIDLEEVATNLEKTTATADNAASDASSAYEKLNDYIDHNDPRVDNLEDTVANIDKKDLFIDMWNQACGTNGRYNAETGYFELNGLTDITYEQAIDIYNAPRISYPNLVGFQLNAKCRTLIKYSTTSTKAAIKFTWNFCEGIYEVLSIGTPYVDSIDGAFANCKKLKTIDGRIVLYNIKNELNDTFKGCYNLTTINLHSLSTNINFSDSPLLSLESFQYMIANAANDSEITITVHPDVYAKLTDVNNAEWYQVLTDATAKQIIFATV